ncbi:MAG TPA: DUF4032 domain-containing protein [Ktedonobacterales bacterium]|nr:DUF4032 domain-containing protein [Ktedonobacterales bacterium]
MPKASASRSVTFELPRADRVALAALPWEAPLEDWPALGVQAIYVRRGESRHTVLFVEAEKRRYAIKETSPEVARKEISQLLEIRRRGIYALEPVGVVVAPGPPIAVGEIAGVTQYMPGDRGYCITRLAQRVIPQALLYRYPFTRRNRQMLWNAIIALLLNLHERGIFWGDPSLANTLIDLSQHKVRALLADAETVELYPGPLEEHRRQEDLAALQESLLWTGEDIRLARGGGQGPLPITEEDLDYIAQHYAALRRMRSLPDEDAEPAPALEEARDDHAHATAEAASAARAQDARPLTPVERVAGQLSELGYSLLDLSWRAILATSDGLTSLRPRAVAEHAETARPRWYQQRIQQALGVRIPRPYARQFYEHIQRHKWLMSERANREIPLEEAARDWYARHHLPAITLLRTYFPNESDSLEVYLGVLDRKWQLSLRAGFETSLEEAAIDYALRHARSADLLHRAFVAVASLLPQRSELLHVVRPEDQRREPLSPTE